MAAFAGDDKRTDARARNVEHRKEYRRIDGEYVKPIVR